MDLSYRNELKDALKGKAISLPQVFIRGKYIGGAEEIKLATSVHYFMFNVSCFYHQMEHCISFATLACFQIFPTTYIPCVHISIYKIVILFCY
jgi:hypothetical protein